MDILALDGQGVLSSDDEEEVAGQLHYLPVVRGGGEGAEGRGSLTGHALTVCALTACTPVYASMHVHRKHADLCAHAGGRGGGGGGSRSACGGCSPG